MSAREAHHIQAAAPATSPAGRPGPGVPGCRTGAPGERCIETGSVRSKRRRPREHVRAVWLRSWSTSRLRSSSAASSRMLESLPDADAAGAARGKPPPGISHRRDSLSAVGHRRRRAATRPASSAGVAALRAPGTSVHRPPGIEQPFDGPAAAPGHALLDLAGLFRDMDVDEAAVRELPPRRAAPRECTRRAGCGAPRHARPGERATALRLASTMRAKALRIVDEAALPEGGSGAAKAVVRVEGAQQRQSDAGVACRRDEASGELARVRERATRRDRGCR